MDSRSGNRAPFLDGVSFVASRTERDDRFPSPHMEQRVFNKESGNIERWDGSKWVVVLLRALSAKMYGAAGDGVTDDTAALQTAINSAVATNMALHLPAGNYLLNGTRQSAYLSNSGRATLVRDALLTVPSGLRLWGDGYKTVLKVADNYTSGGDYRVFAPAAKTTTDIEISGIRIDGNAANNLVIDSKTNLRRAYMINFLAGDNVYIHNNWFENCPGRSVINLGNNTAGAYDYTNVRIINNHIKDVGGAITGNGNQNDHSSVYLQGNGCLVRANIFANTTQPNAFGSRPKNVVALEIHGKNTTISENQAHNFTGGGNLVAQVHDGDNNQWLNNRFTGMSSNVLVLVSAAGYTNRRLTIRGNVLEIDNSINSGGTGIYQNPTRALTSTALLDLTIDDNTIYATVAAPQPVTWYGIFLCAFEGASIRRNVFRNIQGSPICLEASADARLSVRNGDIEDNNFVDCGIHTSVSRPWSIYVSNSSTDDREIANLRIEGNRSTRTAQKTVFSCRGIRVEGVSAGSGGYVNVVILENNFFEGIQRDQRYELEKTTHFRKVGVVPKRIPHTRASDPTSGFWQNGIEEVVFNDPVSGGFVGKIPTTSGSAVSGVWRGATTYAPDQWIRTSTNKVLRCITPGVSAAGTEPNPSSLGALVSDGTITWMFVDTVIAVFKPFGVIS